jgi:SlyX protein
MSEARITRLETLAAEQDRAVNELSAEVFRQQQELTGLRRELEQLRQKLEEGSKTASGPAEAERPPHY